MTWQPIETVPKGARVQLGWWSSADNGLIWVVVVDTADKLGPHVSHWMPLPPAPGAKP